MSTDPFKIYSFDKITVFFKNTDYNGFIHPYNFFEWMSYTREAYFQELVPNFLDLCNRNIKMVTANVEFCQLEDGIFGDQILVKIWAENVKRLSFEVIFEFLRKRDGARLGEGRQRLTFLDAESGKPARIPEELKAVVQLYEKRKSPEPGSGRVESRVGT